MWRIVLLLSLFFSYLFSIVIDIDKDRDFCNILQYSEVYIDKTESLTINQIKNKSFIQNSKQRLTFGYSPKVIVWIRFKLENNSSTKIDKLIEYANPLTTNVTFFDPKYNIVWDAGFTHNFNKDSINPTFPITLEPYSSRVFYIKAYSHITTLIIDINLWNSKKLYRHELRNQIILSLFFGAIGIIVLYNFLIYLGTKEYAYLYYVLFFIGVAFHHLLYKGIASLYLFPPYIMEKLVEFSSFIVAFPIFFLALFVKKVLNLKIYPNLNKILDIYLIFFPFLISIVYIFGWYQYRNFFSILLLLFIFFILIYAFFKKNKQALYLIIGLSLFISSSIFMQLSSLGYFDIFEFVPYYTEMALVIHSLFFSLSLVNKIKQLHQEKLEAQNSLIEYQNSEQNRLSNLVAERTKELKISLREKELLLKELNHRVKNSIQTIVSFLRLQIDEVSEQKSQKILRNIENRILAINHLYSLLHSNETIDSINAYEYFSLLVDDITTSFDMPHINISIDATIKLPSSYAIYCGFILNEAITNALQHAFPIQNRGNIKIKLKKNISSYQLLFLDDGIGYNNDKTEDSSLGMTIIQTLVENQLRGKLTIKSINGTKIIIEWRDNV